MSHSLAQPRRLLTIPRVVGLIVWTGLFYAALAIANLSGDWGHAICGAWGCGPPLQALVGCHLAWCFVLGPVVIALDKCSALAGHSKRWLGGFLMLAAVAAVLAIVVYQRFTWWADAGDWKQSFFWQRCGFMVITTTDIPLIQLFACGLFLRIRSTEQAAWK